MRLTVLDKPYYKSLTRNMIPLVIIVSMFPMVLVSLVILNRFEGSYNEKVNAHLGELVLKHKQHIDTFLADKTSDIKVLSRTFGIETLCNDAFLNKKLAILQQEYRGVFVDLGVVNDQGHQVAYAGPFKLGRANYAGAGWFKKAMTSEVFISDVFLGLRGLPHFIISVNQEVDGRRWILRATIDFVAFNTLVENIRIGETGFALIINQDNEFQTKPRMDISGEKSVYQALLEKGAKDSGVQISRHEDLSGSEYIYASAFLKNGDWLLVFRQKSAEAFSIIRQAQHLALLILVAGGLGIVTMAYLLSRRVVGLIARADREKELMNQQVIESGKLASVGELASGVAHEINNPVAIMMEEAGWLMDLLAEGTALDPETGAEFHRALNQIQTQGKRCKAITHKLLSFARKTEVENQEVDVNQLIHEILDLTRQRARYANVVLESDTAQGLPPVRSSNTELQQIFLNLINNAIDAMENTGGRVRVRSRCEGSHVLVAITDNGPGIPQSNLARIFDPFFTTKPVGKGTGLGLSICYGIIHKMGGSIDVQSTLDKGTRFYLRIPAASPDAGPEKAHLPGM